MNKVIYTLILNGSQIVTIGLSILFQILLLRSFNVKEVGTITSYLALINIISNVFCFGLNNFLISKFSHDTESIKYFRNALLKYIFITAIIATLVFILLGINISKDTIYLIMFLPLIFSISYSGLISSFLQLKEKFILIALVLLYVPLIKVIGILISLYFNNSLYIFLITIFVLSLLFFLYCNRLLNSQFLPKSFQKYKTGKLNIIGEVIPFGILNFSFLIYTNITLVILGFQNLKDVSAYLSTAYLIINCILMIPTLLIQKIYSTSIHKLLFDKDQLIFKLLKKLIGILIIYGILVIIAYYFTGDFFINILFKEHANEILYATNILLLSIFFRLLNLVNGVVLSSLYFIKKRMIYEIVMCSLFSILIFLIVGTKNLNFILYGIVVFDILWSLGYFILFNKYVKGYLLND